MTLVAALLAAAVLPCSPPGATGQVMRAAPTVPFTITRQTPQRLLRTIVGRFGDRSLIRARIEHDGNLPLLGFGSPRVRGAQRLRLAWEQTLVAGALRDMLCAARAPLLWGWFGLDGKHGTPDLTYPYLQHFPTPPEGSFRRRLVDAADRWHFRVVDGRYLHPLQGAPLIVVRTADPLRLAHAAGAIRAFLEGPASAFRFEGFYFEAEDAHGRPAFALANAFRGTYQGSQWARSERLFPFAHG